MEAVIEHLESGPTDLNNVSNTGNRYNKAKGDII